MVPNHRNIAKASEESEEDGKDKVHRLVDLVVREVSMVDRGANKRKFLIRKRQEDGEMGKKAKEVYRSAGGAFSTSKDDDQEGAGGEVPVISKSIKDALVAGLGDAFEKITEITKAVKAATEKEDAGVPGAFVYAVSDVSNTVSELLSGCDVETLKSVVKSEDKESRARKLLWMVMDQINNGALMDAQEQKLVDSVLGMLNNVVSKNDLENIELTSETKSAIDESLTEIGKSMGAVIKSIDDTDETEEGDPVIPDNIEKALLEINSKMVDLSKQYEPSDDADNTADEIKNILDGVLADLVEEKQVDKSKVTSLKRLLGTEDDASNDDEGAGATNEPDEGSGNVKKVGAKISASRLRRFKEAFKILVDLMNEVIPISEQSGWSGKTSKKVQKKSTRLDSEAIALEKRIGELKEKATEEEAKLKKVRTDLAKAERRVLPSNSTTVENLHKKGSGKSGEVDWPRDLNEPDD